ncbi:MAG: hypothetical protein GX594_13025 [Pirellulaceae bacterium]|nr:hypothetical protein [Pirellulaceae bacterium]
MVLMALCMLCWGAWANAFSLTRGKHRFELFHWDYAIGVLLGSLALAAWLGPASAIFHGSMDTGKAGWALLAGQLSISEDIPPNQWRRVLPLVAGAMAE